MTDYRASVGRIAAAIALLLSVALLGGHGYAAEPPAAQETPEATAQETPEATAQEPAAQESPAAQEAGYPDCALGDIASPPATGCILNRATADESLLWSTDEGSRYRLNLVDGSLLITYFDGSSILLDRDGNVIRITDGDASPAADSLAATGLNGRLIGVAISLIAAGGIALAATAARRRL